MAVVCAWTVRMLRGFSIRILEKETMGRDMQNPWSDQRLECALCCLRPGKDLSFRKQILNHAGFLGRAAKGGEIDTGEIFRRDCASAPCRSRRRSQASLGSAM